MFMSVVDVAVEFFGAAHLGLFNQRSLASAGDGTPIDAQFEAAASMVQDEHGVGVAYVRIVDEKDRRVDADEAVFGNAP